MKVVRAAALSCVLGTVGADAAPELGPMLGQSRHHVHAMDLNSTYGGNKMERTFLGYEDLPMGEAALIKAGWTKHNSVCDPNLGFVWTEDAAGATKKKPLKLYTTAGGQPQGVGVIILGYGESPLPASQMPMTTAKPLVDPKPSNAVAHLDIAFREGAVVCSGAKAPEAVGNVLIANPLGNAQRLPTVEADAKAQGWVRGSCFDSMGWHWFLNTDKKGVLPNSKSNLFPVIVMYNGGQLNSIFFSTPNDQVSIPFLSSNEWEPKALSPSEMCKNTCDKDCDFSDAKSYSTMHIYFNDHKSVTCPKNLECSLKIPFTGKFSCCEGNEEIQI